MHSPTHSAEAEIAGRYSYGIGDTDVGKETMTINFAPGETNVYRDQFSPSVLLFWLKSEMAVTSTRIMLNVPNTILGVIPVGGQKRDQPLKNIAEVGVSVRMSIKRLIVGLFMLMVATEAVVLLIPALVILASVVRASIAVVNNGGGVAVTDVSIFEKAKLQKFADEVNQRLFADQEVLRHQAVMAVQQDNLTAQLMNAQLSQIGQERQLEATLAMQPPPPQPQGELPQEASNA